MIGLFEFENFLGLRAVENRSVLALSALLLVAACGSGTSPEATGISERVSANTSFQEFCSSANCSQFPAGYHSVKMLESWLYIPIRVAPSNTVSGQGSWNNSRIYLHPSDERPTFYEYDEPSLPGIRLLRTISPEPRSITLDSFCCPLLAYEYDEPGSFSGLQDAQIRIYPGYLSPLSTKLINAANAQEIAKGAGLTDQVAGFYVKPDINEPDHVQIDGVSMQPVAMAQFLRFSCLRGTRIFCDIASEHNEDSEYPAIRIVNYMVSECIGSECTSEFGSEAMFAEIKSAALQIEALIDAYRAVGSQH